MNRRRFLSGMVLAAEWTRAARAGGTPMAMTLHDASWAAWKDAFLGKDGRVIDHLQSGASHSEGQGFGLVLSVYHGDRAAFDAIHHWTKQNLSERADGLLNWRRLPGASSADPVNATDGDLFTAWGLMLGADRFDLPEARAQAQQIAAAISKACLHPDPRMPSRLLLLPASTGFVRDSKVIFNPSYIMPRALYDLANLTRDDRLARAASDGLDLLTELATQSALPDWAEVDAEGVRPSTELPGHFGYDAIRVALYLIWSGQRDHWAVERAAKVYAAAIDGLTPVVVRLADGYVIESSTYAGFAALQNLVLGRSAINETLDVTQGYYPATLEMLCRIAAFDTSLASTPN